MKIYSYVLPQFYSTPENDEYWGKGFTDWVNTKKAKPLFKNHKQPILPSDKNFYDLSDLEANTHMNNYSIKNGIDGFGYWHYWFDEKTKTLEKVQEIHLSNKGLKQNFFFAWANTNWTKSWIGDDKTTIFEQTYSKKSALKHFEYITQFIEDERYIKINGLPIFQVLNPHLNKAKEYILFLEQLSREKYGKGFYWFFPADKDIVGLKELNHSQVGFPPGDTTVRSFSFRLSRFLQRNNLIKGPVVIKQSNYLKAFKKIQINCFKNKTNYIPCLLSGWDNTPRYKRKGFLIDGLISDLIREQLSFIKRLNNKSHKIILIKAWNEWAEGNVLESYSFEENIDTPLDVILDFKNNNKVKN
jgi:hypothetical protein